jgi:hypothetical protein
MTTTRERPVGSVGQRIELARYTLPDGTIRLLIGQRMLGHVRLIDAPQAGPGRSYVVETELEQDGYAAVQALVADYIDVGTKRGEIPSAGRPIDRYLDHMD